MTMTNKPKHAKRRKKLPAPRGAEELLIAMETPAPSMIRKSSNPVAAKTGGRFR